MQTTYRTNHLTDPRHVAISLNIARRKTDPLDLSADQSTLIVDRPLTVTGAYQIGGVQVVGPRITGWTAATGTPSRGAFAAAAAGTASASYVQSELQGALNRIAALEARLVAYDADLRTTGLIGT
jgi:hypothetical protein